MQIRLVSWPIGKSVHEVTDDITLTTGKTLESEVGKELFLHPSSKRTSQPILTMFDVNDNDIAKLAGMGIIIERIQ